MKKTGFLVALSDVSEAGCSKGDSIQPLTDKFDPLFAQELQKRGYIADASCIMPEDVKNITELDVSRRWNSNLRTAVDFTWGELTSLRGIEYFESLQKLSCQWNQLTTLNISKNTALTILNCSYNLLTSLDVSKNTVLKRLECDFNQLTSLDVSKNTVLKRLECGGNRLNTLDVSKNTVLEELNCSENQLTTLDVSKNTVLKLLECGGNRLNTLDVSKNTVLEELVCSENQLTTLDVSKNTVLKRLECDFNQLTSLDVSKNTVLINLSCEKNPGDGYVFPVTAWFDNNSIPRVALTTGSWEYDGKTVWIDYRKAK